VCVALGIAGCGANQQELENRGEELASERFAFEFNCPKNKVETSKINEDIGASGCGKRKVYKITCLYSALGAHIKTCEIKD
jgi:hypothetical protein